MFKVEIKKEYHEDGSLYRETPYVNGQKRFLKRVNKGDQATHGMEKWSSKCSSPKTYRQVNVDRCS